jgi:hypothetical protein
VRIFWFLAKAFTGLLALLVLLTALGMYLNSRALAAASDFCASVPPGTPRDALIGALRETERRYRDRSEPERIQVLFQGWVFNAATCTLDFEKARVVRGTVALEGD